MKRLSVPAQYLPVFCRELYQLVRSGIPIAEGLAMLREDETGEWLRIYQMKDPQACIEFD